MRRLARAAAALIAFFMLATPAPRIPLPGPGEPSGARLFAEAVPLNTDDPAQDRLGPLLYLGGWSLSSDDRRFGAISGLAVDGDRLLALSDLGMLLRFAPPPGDRVEIVPLADGPGERASKIDRDSESLALHGGKVWIGYENSNEIWRYRMGDWRAEARHQPPAMRRWSANHGAEALLRLADGRFLAIREDVDDDGVSDGLLFSGDPAEPATQAQSFKVDPPRGQRITDAAQLPDGRLLLLTRGFGMWTGWTARLLLAPLPQAGSILPVEEIAAFESPLTRDNLEGLAIGVENGRTIVWIASDDNLMPLLQRTLLLKFEWVG